MVGSWLFTNQYQDRWEKMDDRQIPPKEAFYSNLTDTHIWDEDYEHALKVFQSSN